MSKDNSSANLSGFGITLLTIAFVVLKLCKVIDWSWWWVLSPMWIMAIITIVCIVVYVIYLFKQGRL